MSIDSHQTQRAARASVDCASAIRRHVGAPVSAERNGKDERELTQLKELLEMYAFLDGAGNDEQ